MDRSEAEQMHSRLAGELADIEGQIARLTDRRDALHQIVVGLEKLYPEVLASDEPEAPPPPKTIGDGLERIFQDLGGEQWTVTGDLVTDLKNRGWLGRSSDPEAAVRAALRRLLDRGVLVRRHADGRALEYKLRTPEDSPPPVEVLNLDEPVP